MPRGSLRSSSSIFLLKMRAVDINFDVIDAATITCIVNAIETEHLNANCAWSQDRSVKRIVAADTRCIKLEPSEPVVDAWIDVERF